MNSTKVVLVISMMFVSGGAAQAGFFDVVRTVGNVADNVSETQRALAEGRVPNLAVKGGGGRKHAGGGGNRKK